jgi:hypothetical protein
MSKLTDARLRKTLKKVSQPQTGWTEEATYVLGKADGTILTGIDGIVYVRHPQNGQVLTVYNNSVAPTNRPGLQVTIGKLAGESEYRIKGFRNAYAVPVAGSAGNNAHTHNDMFFSWDRFIPFLVSPLEGGGLNVRITGNVFLKRDNTFAPVENQTLDLESYKPISGAKYVLIEADDDGVIHVNEGETVAAMELLSVTDIPALTNDRAATGGFDL